MREVSVLEMIAAGIGLLGAGGFAGFKWGRSPPKGQRIRDAARRRAFLAELSDEERVELARLEAKARR